MSTEDKLKAAFAGESQANRKYLAYAQKAQAEGYTQIARLFRATAEAETVHAHNHFKALGMVRSVAENLQDAVAGENYEVEEMYPAFLAEAREENVNAAAIRSFEYALAVEKTHRGLYTEALKTLQTGQDLAAAPIYVCPVCGHTAIGEAPDKCPVCGAPKSKFFEVK